MKRIWPYTSAIAALFLFIWIFSDPVKVEQVHTGRPVLTAATAPPPSVASAEAIARLRTDPSVLLPGDSRRGWTVFHKQSCVECHAIWGLGGEVGPDLGRVSLTTASSGDLVAAFWNHGPRMWTRTRELGSAPLMTLDETADLIAFLTFVKTLDPPGDPTRGRAILAERRCLDCHQQGDPGQIPKIIEWTRSSNPVAWAAKMWEHASKMKAEMARRRIVWPQLKPTDLADIIAYVRTVGRPEVELFLRPGSPRRGEEIFFSNGCARCHVVEGRGKGWIDLGAREFPRTLSGIAARMWNEYPAMHQAAGGREGGIPALSAQKMTDVLSFLLAIRYFGAEGDAARGREVYTRRGCVTCHKGDRAGGIASKSGDRFSTIELAQAMWNHGPIMAERMAAVGMTWPTLEGSEVTDLVKYLDELP